MTPTCPTCNVEMTEGFVLDWGHFNTRHVSSWVEGEPQLSWLGNLEIDGHRKFAMQAFRCPECGLLHLYANKRVY